MATEEYKGEFKSLSKKLGMSIKEIRAMPDDDLDMLIESRRDLKEQAETVREMGGMNKGGMSNKRQHMYAGGGSVTDNLKPMPTGPKGKGVRNLPDSVQIKMGFDPKS